MRGDSESRSRYLSIALTSRSAINGLRRVVAGQPLNAELNVYLKQLIAGTDQDRSNFASHLQASGAWTHFEELSTIEEIEKETQTHDLVNLVQSVIRGSADGSQGNAMRLIGFLTAVEGRALQRYSELTELRMA